MTGAKVPSTLKSTMKSNKRNVMTIRFLYLFYIAFSVYRFTKPGPIDPGAVAPLVLLLLVVFVFDIYPRIMRKQWIYKKEASTPLLTDLPFDLGTHAYRAKKHHSENPYSDDDWRQKEWWDGWMQGDQAYEMFDHNSDKFK